jgi:3-hydroxyacyl-CoA dehydrogenase, NAD binding domain
VVIEAVFESLDLKRKIFKALDEISRSTPRVDWVTTPAFSGGLLGDDRRAMMRGYADGWPRRVAPHAL